MSKTGSELDFAATREALHNGVVAFAAQRDVISVTGPDARSYLDSQLSQDLSQVEPGDAREAFVLTPRGHVEFLVEVIALENGEHLVLVDTGYGQALLERLVRFKIRVKASLELDVARPVLLIRGPRAGALDPAALTSGLSGRAFGRRPDGAVDVVLGDEGAMSGDAGLHLGDSAALELARIEAAVPAMANELSDGPIPQETGYLDTTVSFTKGCYPGQELVAWIDARGSNVARRLVRLETRAETGSLGRGSELVNAQGDPVGLLTSLAPLPGGGAVGLGYVKRSVPDGDAIEAVETPSRRVSFLTRPVHALP